jgi:hypothetical protein
VLDGDMREAMRPAGAVGTGWAPEGQAVSFVKRLGSSANEVSARRRTTEDGALS